MTFKYITTLLLLIHLSAQANSENITELNIEKTNSIIEKAITAFGGREKLDSIKQLEIDSKVIYTASFQSRKPEPPWDVYESTETQAIDLDKEIFIRIRNEDDRGGIDHIKNIINGENSMNIDFITKSFQPVSAPDNFEQSISSLIRSNPILLMQQLTKYADTATYIGTTQLNNHPHDVIRFKMDFGPAISLYFDRKDNLPKKSERLLPIGLVEYYFDNYEKTQGYIVYKLFKLVFQGEDNVRHSYNKITINQPLDDLLTVDSGFTRLETAIEDGLNIQELDKGVFLVGEGNSYFLVVDMGDHLMSIGGTGTADAKLAEVRKKTGNKPLKYAALTHHHLDHIHAVESLSNLGATLVTVKENATAIERSLNGKSVKPKMEFVNKMREFKGINQTVQMIDIGPTPHADHMLVAYLPHSKLLFEADHFNTFPGEPIAPATPNTQALAKAIKNQKLTVEKLVGAHNRRILTIDELNQSLQIASQQ